MAKTPRPKAVRAGASKQVLRVESAARVVPIMKGTMNIQTQETNVHHRGHLLKSWKDFAEIFLQSKRAKRRLGLDFRV
jgi:hypothetical protein